MSVSIQTVSEDEADTRLDRFLRRRYPGLTQGALQKLCRTGQVRVDGHRVEASARLSPGQAVRVPPMPAAPEKHAPIVSAADAKEMERMVLHRDDHLIVLNKPSGLATQGGPGITRHLDGMLDALRGEGDRPRLVHRLDRDTSGVIVLARTAGVAAKLAAAFRTREVEKTYWAVVVGHPDPEEGQIDQPLKRVSSAFGERTVAADRKDKEGQRAYTNYRMLDAAGRKLAWLELQPLTGRTHQLRVHCVSLGTPIVGDAKYAEPRDNGSGGSYVEGLADRLHLHARALTLPHPAGGTLSVAAELPPHMRESFTTLGFHAPAPPAVTRKDGWH
jgi:23S rRNA pseudouridine955/2504/2580 synthase